MSLGKAWTILGRDPEKVMATLKAVQGMEARSEAAEKAYMRAQKIARGLLAQCHPDRNQGDSAAHAKFLQIQAALDTIKYYTEELKEKILEARKKEENLPDGFIMIRKK
jgi:hypothetical protein